ncbi:7 transmembrane receptor domain-containing protein isoform X4 [Nerophis ophidion]|uniref:7 transmembrane receptor domain-containing protein isoform X4 n=1 Tax=Nerophis ophidion TaxID=159077 RepID=UPI002ADFCC3E|nr:7 transmembrane receptor domain-containing protein isoform X4 [Nerophis ophidion]
MWLQLGLHQLLHVPFKVQNDNKGTSIIKYVTPLLCVIKDKMINVAPVGFAPTTSRAIKGMDVLMKADLTLTNNSSHPAEPDHLDFIKTQGLNHSDPLDMFEGMELLLRFKPLFMPLYCLVVVIASVGNSFLLTCILVDKKLHNATNFFIGNLAAGDLLMCLSCVPLTMSYAFDSHGWAFGRPLCHLVPLLQCATVFASVLSLTAIAVDRYVVLAHPVRRRISLWGCGAVATAVWLLSLALAAPPSFYTRYLDLRPSGVDLVVCEEFWPENGNLRLLYSCFILIASYMIPLLSVSISYCAISLSLKRYAVPGERAGGKQHWKQKRRKTFSLLVASVLAFALCWLPLQYASCTVAERNSLRRVIKRASLDELYSARCLKKA